MRLTEKHIAAFNRLDGKRVTKTHIQLLRDALAKDISKGYIDAHIVGGPECLEVKKKLEKILDAMGNKFSVIEKLNVTKVVIAERRKSKVKKKIQQAKGDIPDKEMLSGLEHIQNDDFGKGEFGELSSSTYKVITDKILELMKDEGLVWRKPWNAGGYGREALAHNYFTKRFYRGTNFYLNYLLGFEFRSPYFMTFKQVNEAGGTIKKGEKGFPVVYFKYLYSRKSDRKLVDEKEAIQDGKLKPGYSQIPALFYYRVYNFEQTEGLKIKPVVLPKLSDKEKIEACEQIVDRMPKRPPISNIHGDRAFYTPAFDKITMPLIKQFSKEQEYYCTLFHEMVHSTGHAKRLSRDLTGSFGSKKYAFEELIAELGASYLCGESGILYFTMKNSAAYIKGWKKRLVNEMTKDPKFFLRAAGAAEKAADFILDREKESEPKADDKPKAAKKTAKGRKPKKRKEASVPGVKASVAQAIDDLVKNKPEKYGKKAMAMSMLYSTFKDSDEAQLVQGDFTQKLLEKEGWIDLDRSTDLRYLKYYVINAKGKAIIDAINGRLTSLRVKKQGGELFPNLKGVVSADQIASKRLDPISLDGEWKEYFSKLYPDTQVMIWGAPGSGKTVLLLKFAQYMAEKGLKVLYVAREEFGRTTFTEKIQEFKIGHANLGLSKLLPPDVSQFDVVILDSVQALRMDLDAYIAWREKNNSLLSIAVIQTTKDGDFRGGKDWEHEMDIAGSVRQRRFVAQKNRLDPDARNKARSFEEDQLLSEMEKKALLKSKLKGKLTIDKKQDLKISA